MIKIIRRILILTLIIIAGMALSMWLVWHLPTSAILALAAGTLAVLAAIGVWRLWIH